MSAHFYFNPYIKKFKILDVQLQQSLDNVIGVFSEPAELGVDGLQLNKINLPMPKGECIEYLVSISRILNPCEQKLLRKTEDKIEDIDER